MLHRFTIEQWLPFPVEKVFAFFADPQNLPRLMPTWQKVRIEQIHVVPPPGAIPGSSLAATGSTILLTFRPLPGLPFRQKWLAAISNFASNDYFCDTQQSGPFASWNHCHRLRRERHAGAIGTHVVDEIEYEMKLGVLGESIHTLLVQRLMQRLFAYRQHRTMQLLSVIKINGPTG